MNLIIAVVMMWYSKKIKMFNHKMVVNKEWKIIKGKRKKEVLR